MNEERRRLLSPTSSPRTLGGIADEVHTAALSRRQTTGNAENIPHISADYERPPKWKTRTAFVLVLLTETLERTAFYGLICNMVMFLNSDPLDWASYNAASALFVLNGLSYVLAMFSGWLADSCLGKYKTIVLFFFVYAVGFGFWPLFHPWPQDFTDAHSSTSEDPPNWCSFSSHDTNVTNETSWTTQTPRVVWYNESCAWAVYLSIAIISIGYGAVRVNIIPFGAFQIEHEGGNAMRTYFNWFYWCINIGSLMSYGGLAYLQQEVSYFWGYIAPVAALGVAFLVFLSGTCLYTKKAATGSVIANICSVVK